MKFQLQKLGFPLTWNKNAVPHLWNSIVLKLNQKVYCEVVRVPQLEPCPRRRKISFLGGQKFWVGLLFSEFSVDLTEKRHRAKLVEKRSSR